MLRWAERGRKSEEIKTARAWPRAAQYFYIAIKKSCQ